MSVFTVFLAIVAGLLALALIVLFVTMVVLALRGRSRAVESPRYRDR